MAEKRITFYGVDNGQAVLVTLDDKTHVMFDIRQKTDDADEDDKTVDVQERLLKTLPTLEGSKRHHVSVFCLSHSHLDHCQGVDRVFRLPVISDQEDSDDLIQIDELWVTAAIFGDDVEGPAKLIKKEAKRRLALYADPAKSGKAEQPGNMLVVFGHNEKVADLAKMPRFRRPGAGEIFKKICGTDRSDWETFVHCPFRYITEGKAEDRNDASLIIQATMKEGEAKALLLLGGDAGCAIWRTVYNTSKQNRNIDRLDWDIFFVPHHGSCKFFTEKEHEEGRDEARDHPAKTSMGILDRGRPMGWLVCSSRPVREKNYEDEDPPHTEATGHYKKKAKDLGDESRFVCLMQYPTESEPDPLVLRLTSNGLQAKHLAAPAIITGSQAAGSPKHWG